MLSYEELGVSSEEALLIVFFLVSSNLSVFVLFDWIFRVDQIPSIISDELQIRTGDGHTAEQHEDYIIPLDSSGV